MTDGASIDIIYSRTRVYNIYGASMSFDDSGSQTLLRYFPSVQRSPENQSEECNTIESETDEISDPEDITLEPCQPRNEAIKFGAQSRSFQKGWFDKWKWLDWNDSRSCVYCHPWQ